MTKTNNSLSRRLVRTLGSEACFRAIIALFVLQAAWIALSGRYPMAFDEDFHLGIIRLYAHHGLPFWSGQPANADMFGAVARDPSYLYQYLMSFPYRLISWFTNDQNIQVIILRFIDIGLFAWGVALYRRLMFKTGVSRALIHTCLLAFVLVPIVPLLAAQINYDDLLLPVIALTLLLTLRLDASLVKDRRLDAKTLLQLLITCLLGSLVKYAFLPIFVAVAGFVVVRLWQNRRDTPRLWRGLMASWRMLSRWTGLSLALLFVLSVGLFVERYGINIVRYHTPIPDCSQVLTVQQCSAYGPWIRNYTDKLNKAQMITSPIIFNNDWLYGMWLRTFFAVDGPATNFQTRGPLLIPGISAIVFAVTGGVAILVTLPRLLRKYDKPVFWLLVATSLTYIATLWLDEYRDLLGTGQPVAINGRYLIPVFLPVFLVMAIAVRELLGRRQNLKLIVASSVIICFAWGGGALTYILRSNDAWYWPNSTVRTANHAVQRVLKPIVPGYGRPTQFLH